MCLSECVCGTIYCPVSARKATSAAEVIEQVIERLRLDRTKCYVLAEVKEFGGEEWILNPSDCPVQRMMLWPRMALENRSGGEDYRFLLREKNLDGSIHYGSLQMWLQVTEERRRMVERGFLPQPPPKDYNDLCNLPDLNEKTLLDNLRSRFKQEKIYTYVGSILIVINPFKFLPIYNPKYVKMYDNHHLGKLEPHIYAVADVAYHAMLQRRRDQCIVISGESGSGKTQSTNFLIHHLTALSQKGFASGVEQTILGAGPVLEAFGNAKTAHNNNSSRFGKFIQVNYQESGTVRGAYVEKYLLEKSRLSRSKFLCMLLHRNYHVFYYLLAGAREEERKEFHLIKPEEYHYLNQVGTIKHTKYTLYAYYTHTLYHQNVKPASEQKNVVSFHLDTVKEEMLFEALTTRKTVTVGEKLIVPYKLAEAVAVRDSMAKSLYSALFDWIVFRINHALLNNRDLEEMTKILSIGVLDIFGFEDYEINSFEQFCINFANERLQHYFNQHIFKLEQEEYRAEGISWHNIDYTDNSGCILLISKKPTGLLHLLDEECNFPQATNQTLLDKFKRQHEGSSYIEFPAVMEPAFIIRHYAGKVKYRVKDFREKNTDHMRPDIVALLKSSRKAFIVSLIGIHPVATFRWAVLRAYFRAVVAFRLAGKRFKEKRSGECQHVIVQSSALLHSAYFSHQMNRNYKQKPCLPKHLLDVKSLKYLSNLTLHDRITKSLLHLHKKKKPPSISAQFQASLNKLMETLDQSEPYFVKCIRSNADKLPVRFSDGLVLRQLRYTGMLETVRIRQSGYSIKYSFQEFARHFRVLLAEGTRGTQESIQSFLCQTNLKTGGFQVGHSMVFLHEAERQRLQDLLHQEVVRRIVALQRRFRASLQRRRYLRMRQAACLIQVLLTNAYLSPPHSPDQTLERGQEFKENKEPSPKVKRRRSVKISSVALEPGQWQNDSLQILTCTNDYCSMNEFLMKKVLELTSCSKLIYFSACKMRLIDMSVSCVVCRYACHRKCCAKTNTKCSKKVKTQQFGVDVSRLTSDERLVPLVVEKLINYIEMHGLYTEGIYRKSGSTNKVKELKQALDTDVDNVNLDDFNIHVIASVFKQWLRDLPNPLMSFELYEDFLRALGLQDRKEAVRAVYGIIDQLSRTHLNTLERLIFHLVRIALQVETNRMSANALAIVFAPCILRCPDTTDPLLSVQDISKTTACVELIIAEQMIKYKTRLKDISSLEFAENKAKSRLTLIRRSMVRTFPKSVQLL
uniref:Myosin IXA n=1 Tax=Denticeps clupeoides TaxID=299321 RepID=A0AAY4CNV2_9TELE